MTDDPKKRWIKLKERADIAGEVRYPEEDSILVPAGRAAELIKDGKASPSSEPKLATTPAAAGPIEPDGKGG